MKYRLLLTYDGSSYGGWQTQANAPSIQATVESALSTALRIPMSIVGAGRTDAGVHAKGQVAHFSSETSLDTFRLLRSLNGLLPMEIRILEIIEVPESFHARYAATSKLYTYHLHLSPVLDPFTYKYRHHPLHPVDLSLLTQAASLFLGTHDFSAFANESHTEGTRPSPIRTLRRLDVTSEEGGVRLEFEAEGFLYKMVRNITGTLLDVSSGRLPLEEIPKIFASKDRRRASSAAPAQGLFLMRVGYDPQEKTRGTR